MIIELLTFSIDVADQAEWIEVEAGLWTKFLSMQPGFVRKEVWVDPDRPEQVSVVVWWHDKFSWESVDEGASKAVDERMGAWWRPATCRTFHVVRAT
jgi:uncharacterized protein (TIGR03792 family)